MISAFKCRAYASECRAICDGMGEARSETLTMAAVWERLAREAEEAVLLPDTSWGRRQ